MSTGHTYNAAKTSDAAFETHDVYFACFLPYAGYDIMDLRAEGRHKVFVFHDRPTRRDDLLAIYGDAISVQPMAFGSTIKEMNGLLHNG